MPRYAPSIPPEATLDLARLRDAVQVASAALYSARRRRDLEIRRLRESGAEPRDLTGPGGVSVAHIHRILTQGKEQ